MTNARRLEILNRLACKTGTLRQGKELEIGLVNSNNQHWVTPRNLNGEQLFFAVTELTATRSRYGYYSRVDGRQIVTMPEPHIQYPDTIHNMNDAIAAADAATPVVDTTEDPFAGW